MKNDFKKSVQMYRTLPVLLQASLVTGLALGIIGYITGIWYTKTFNTYIPILFISIVTMTKDFSGILLPSIIKKYNLKMTGYIAVTIAILDIVMLYLYINYNYYWSLIILYITVVPIYINNNVRAKMLKYYMQNTGINIAKYELVMQPVFSLNNLIAAGLSVIITSIISNDHLPVVILILTIIQFIPELYMLIIINKLKLNLKGDEILKERKV